MMMMLMMDGATIDDTQASNFVALLRETRSALDQYSHRSNGGRRLLLTTACPAGRNNYEKLRIAEMDQYLDLWNLMAYDYAGAWDGHSGHQANLHHKGSNAASTPFNTDAAIEHYTRAGGVPTHKIVLGMPLYGRAFVDTDGPGAPYRGGVGDGSWEKGIWDYKTLPHPGAAELVDDEAGASYSYDAGRRIMVSYDTPEMARRKADYVARRGLGGAMWWESSGDVPGNQDHQGRGLISTVSA